VQGFPAGACCGVAAGVVASGQVRSRGLLGVGAAGRVTRAPGRGLPWALSRRWDLVLAPVPETLAEREHELSQLESRLDRYASGRGATLLFEGPAGIGKTTLLRVTERLAARRGAQFLSARCSELERTFAFGAVRQLLESWFVASPGAERSRVLAGSARHAPVARR
jgi:hypothetical protein